MKRLIPYILTFTLAAACVYPLDIQTEDYSGDTLVIDGSVIIGGTTNVTISHLVPLDQVSAYAGGYVHDAVVTVESDKGDVYKDDSYPYTINTAGAPADRSYRLVVEHKEKTYSSAWIKPLPAPKISDIQFSADDNNVSVSLSAASDTPGYAAIQYDEIWKFHVDYVRIFDYSPRSGITTIQDPDLTYYICWRKFVGVNEVLLDYSSTGGNVTEYPFISFPRTSERFQYEYNILVKIRNLYDDEYHYFKHLEDANNSSSLFSPDPGNAETNIVCESDPSEKVFGYVSVSCQDYYIATIDDRYYIAAPVSKLLHVDKLDYFKYYDLGFLPVNMNSDGTIGWGSSRCYNCVSDGGTLKKPSFDLPKN